MLSAFFDLDPATTWRYDVDSLAQIFFGLRYHELADLIYPEPEYRSFQIKKRGGGVRQILEPRRRVKQLQVNVLEKIRAIAYPEKPCVHGFVMGRSIVTNASAHASDATRFILNIDLSDFFPSITFFRVRGLFRKKPFEFSFEVATVLAHLCTFDGKLPQGAPTSPFISNLICRGLDKELTELAKRHRATYTRYADDITFSFSTRNSGNLPKGICSVDGGASVVGEELRALVSKHGFTINDSKTRVSAKTSRQEVTGLTVNQLPNVRRRFVDNIRGALHAWEAYGYDAANENWKVRVLKWANEEPSKREWRRQTRTAKAPSLAMLLWGRLLFLRMVRGKEDPLYNRLAEKFNRLRTEKPGGEKPFNVPSLPFATTVLTADEIDHAVYLVEWIGDFKLPSGKTEPVSMQGTAFAFMRDEMLITCDHVFTAPLDGGGLADFQKTEGTMLSLINVASGRAYTADLIARDAPRDLAVLKLQGLKGGERHFTEDSTPAAQTPGWLIGHPNQSIGRPPTKVKTVIAAAYPRGGLQRFELGVQIRKGNSGGPFSSLSFRLLGVVQQGATLEHGNNECLAIGELQTWLKAVSIDKHFLASTGGIASPLAESA